MRSTWAFRGVIYFYMQDFECKKIQVVTSKKIWRWDLTLYSTGVTTMENMETFQNKNFGIFC